MHRQIDLNADLGESYGPWRMGDDATMLGLVSSANIACAGHAGDPEVMFHTLELAHQRGVMIGAHPGYADREGFGRRIIPMSPPEIARMIAAQVGALQGVAALCQAQVRYVKPHGALANLAASDPETADAVVMAVSRLPGDLAVLAISGTALEAAARRHGLPVFAEIFADRGYLANGQLVPRNQPGALIHDPLEASARLMRYLETGRMPTVEGPEIPLEVHSICVHGDNPHAVEMALHLREALQKAGIEIRGFLADRAQ